MNDQRGKFNVGAAMAFLSATIGVVKDLGSAAHTHPSTTDVVTLALVLAFLLTGAVLMVLGWQERPGRELAETGPSSQTASPASPPLVTLGTVRVQDGRGSADPLKWPLKVWVVLHNESTTPIEVGPPAWHANIRGGRLHVHPTEGPGYQYSVEQPNGGAARDHWGPELKQVTVPAGSTFRVWVGLDDTQDAGALQHLTDARQLGALSLPVTSGGETREVRLAV